MTLLALLLSAPAAAQATGPERVVIWLEDALPAEDADKLRRKAQKRVGGTATHYLAQDLAFSPQPWAKADEQAWEELTRAVERGQERWDEFDVELAIAREVDEALGAVTLVRGEEDRDKLIEAQLLLGAAVDMAWSTDDFETSDEAAPWRMSHEGDFYNAALVELLALDPGAAYTRAEVGSGSAYEDLERLRDEVVPSWETATVELGVLPADAALWVDGQPLSGAGQTLELPAGRHFVHVERQGRISGRAVLELAPGDTAALPRRVQSEQVAEASRQVEVDVRDGLPEPVVDAVESLASLHEGAWVYLASVDSSGKVNVLPWTEGAVLIRPEPVTFTLGGELGGGTVATPGFWYADPELAGGGKEFIFAPAANGSFDMELGIYNAAILAGAELWITPNHRLLFGDATDPTPDGNTETAAYVKAHGGLGVYLIRPTTQFKRATLMLGGTYGWFSPGHLGPGGRLSLGIPMGGQYRSWFKITLHGWYGSEMDGFPENTPLFSGGLRLGVQTAL